MTITIEQLQSGIMRYIESDVAPKATGLTKFMIYFALPSLSPKISAIVSSLMQDGTFSDLFDEAGKMKLDEAYARARDALTKSGKIHISKIDYFADETDLTKLYEILKKL